MTTDRLRIVDGSGWDLVADRSGDLPVLWTTSTGLDGGLGVRLTKTARIGDGTFTGPLTRPGREMTFGGVMFGTTEECRAFVRRVAAMWNPGSRGSIERDVDGLHLEVHNVVLDGSIKINPVIEDEEGRVEWEIPLYSGDPYLYGKPVSWQVHTPDSDYGLDWPLFIKEDLITWGLEGSTIVAPRVSNKGTAKAYPSVEVMGDFPAGFRFGDGKGNWVTWRLPVSPGAPVLLDFATHEASTAGLDQSWALTERDFWTIPPGGVVEPVLFPVNRGSGVAKLTTRDTYL